MLRLANSDYAQWHQPWQPQPQQYQQYQGFYGQQQPQAAAEPLATSAAPALPPGEPAPPPPPPDADGAQPPAPQPDASSEAAAPPPLPPESQGQAPQQAQAYAGYSQPSYDAAAWQQYYAAQAAQQQQQQHVTYGNGYSQYGAPAYSQQYHGWQGYQQAPSYQPTYAQVAAPSPPAAVPPPQAQPQQPQKQQPPAQSAVSGNSAPWQKAAEKVAAAMQAKGSTSGPTAAAGKPPPKAGIAKSFSIQPQGSKFQLGSSAKNAFAAASSPAYVKVAEKTTAPAAKPGNFPPAMRSYVERAFLAAKTTEQKAALQPALKKIIDASQAKGELWMTPWDTLPLPNVQALANSATAAAAAIINLASPSPTGGKRNRWDVMRKQPEGWQGSKGASVPSVPDTRHKPDWFNDRKRQKLASSRHWSARQSRSPSSSSESDGGCRRPRSGKGDRPMSAAERDRLQRRAGRFGSGRADDLQGAGASSYRQLGPSRRELIHLASNDDYAEEIDLEQFTIKGTSQKLEKSYFRLTAAPDPASVRPETVLNAALSRLLRLIRAGEVKYLYMLDQFKAMRQDCTVQHLRNELAVRIYQAHARAALEYVDPAEYNQCQTQLNALAKEGVPGADSPEFLAYRLLYQTVHARGGETSALLAALRLATPEMAAHAAVAHALQVRQAAYTDDHAAFFRLYAGAPNMGRALMDMFVAVVRWRALDTLVRAFKPSLAVALVARLLGFVRKQQHGGGGGGAEAAEKAGEAVALEVLPGCSAAVFPGKSQPQDMDADGVQVCVQWLQAHGATVLQLEGEPLLDCKASVGQLHTVQETTAVAHGDENLALDDFLTKVAVETA